MKTLDQAKLMGQRVPQSDSGIKQNHTFDCGVHQQYDIKPNHEPGSNTTNEHISLIYIRIPHCPALGQ